MAGVRWISLLLVFGMLALPALAFAHERIAHHDEYQRDDASHHDHDAPRGSHHDAAHCAICHTFAQHRSAVLVDLAAPVIVDAAPVAVVVPLEPVHPVDVFAFLSRITRGPPLA